MLADLLDVVVVNLKESDGCLSRKKWNVLRHFVSGSYKKLNSRLLWQRHYVGWHENKEIAHTHSLVRQVVQESLLAQIAHFVRKIIQYEAAKNLRKWMCQVIDKRLSG